MSRFITSTVLLISASAVVVLNGQQLASHKVLFNQFCQRSSLRTILNSCIPVAADLTSNVFGSDLYSTALTGQVATDGFDSSRNTYFAIVSTGARGVLYVACESSTTDVIDDNTLVIHPVANFNPPLSGTQSLLKGKKPNGPGYFTSGNYWTGVTIVYSGKIPVICKWSNVN